MRAFYRDNRKGVLASPQETSSDWQKVSDMVRGRPLINTRGGLGDRPPVISNLGQADPTYVNQLVHSGSNIYGIPLPGDDEHYLSVVCPYEHNVPEKEHAPIATSCGRYRPLGCLSWATEA
ncbi:hypothetical protein PISMIDRAFT_20279 [Pisolithus microcarpus 441]|uniref:Uncharacterized protein n=1 Tax=Pisolithus microcarpus 441 TaxID=765257 RepID=A0A0C9XE61_9AGAM|nr:hypothetical protein BKA83DRAFT_20301 [Pisolithus microcarpus]KIK10536.1 hypothetical protein PISMIDRAFT_20301 [Pisolithus microcarpus 441]KIK10560.1 hypothetical protein PISMIDRAFT_20279 [Pisolithus microcarpus 441]